MSETPDHRRLAADFLAEQFGDAAPDELALVGAFPGGELEAEGAVSIFAFEAAPGGTAPEPCFVVAGQTQPNYYPAWDLDPDQMYSVHLGTRFMLVVEVGQKPIDELPGELEKAVREFLTTVVPGERVSDFRPVAAFEVESQIHVVCRLRIADEDVYVIAGDAPPGIYRHTHLPPHVVYRMHLGNLIRAEPTDDEAGVEDAGDSGENAGGQEA